MDRLIDFLSEYYGVIPFYYDIWGGLHRASREQKVAVLESMGVEAHDEASAKRSVEKVMDDLHQRPIAPVISLDEGNFINLSFVLPPGNSRSFIKLDWLLRCEDGIFYEGKREINLSSLPVESIFPGVGEAEPLGIGLFKRCRFEIPVRPPAGYHRLDLQIPEFGLKTTVDVIVSPLEAFEQIRRCWGLAIQLYAARSRRKAGMGSFYELIRIVERASQIGASFVGLSPLHYGYPENPNHISPYSASSRRFLNPLYIVPELDFGNLQEAENIRKDPPETEDSNLINYELVVPARWNALGELYSKFSVDYGDGENFLAEEFEKFVEIRRPLLESFGVFEFLRRYFGKPWYDWPYRFRHPSNLQESELPEGWKDGAKMVAFLQFIAHKQLSYCRSRGLALDPPVFLYTDLAVGVDRGGFDVWYEQECYALNVDVGAPPDDFNPRGQKWGIVPFIPHKLTECSYRPFIDVIRTNMAYASIIRIDHVMGLFRLFWIPSGFSPSEGIYVRYPLDDLARIVTLESVRNGCLVVGEDLGTVPDEIRREMALRKWFSSRVLYFSKDRSGSFLKPNEYPEHSIVSITTHDLPTLIGYWNGTDLVIRKRLGMFISDEIAELYIKQREEDRKKLLEAIMPEVDKLPDQISPEELTKAALLYLARSRSRLMAVQIEDLLMAEDQPNFPGTITEYPSWRIRWSKPLEDLLENNFVVSLLSAIGALRRKLCFNGPDEKPMKF